MVAWLHFGEETSIGGSHQTGHDMAPETHGAQVTHGFDQCIWIGQVGGDGQGCGVLVGAECSHRAAEIQVGDCNDSATSHSRLVRAG